MTILPSFPLIRRWALVIAFIGLCFVIGLVKRMLL